MHRLIYLVLLASSVSYGVVVQLPTGTRSVKIQVDFYLRFNANCDGYVDLVSLSINGSANLVTNNSFETNLTGWTNTIGGPTRVAYTTVPITAPNQPTGGGLFTVNGFTADRSSMYATVDVSAYAAAIDAGTATTVLSVWLGGFTNDPDMAAVTAIAYNVSSTVLGSWSVPGPTKLDRASTAKLISYSRSLNAYTNYLPATTRKIKISFVNFGNDSLFDVVSLALNGGANLVTNPSAETDTSSWIAVDGSVIRYTYVAEGIAVGDQPPSGGLYTFSGGTTANEITQTVDISASATGIDAGTVQAIFSCWMGGFTNQGDESSVIVQALTASDVVLEKWYAIGPTASDRGSVSKMMGPYTLTLGGYSVTVSGQVFRKSVVIQ